MSPRPSDACWICQQADLRQLGDTERVTDPRTGEWAHKTCVDKTTSGAAWRLGLAVHDLRHAVWQAAEPGLRRVARFLSRAK